MTDIDPTDDNEPLSEVVEESGASLRAKLEEANARIRELEGEKETDYGEFRARAMRMEFDRLGMDPGAGIGKAVAVTFDGEPEQLAEYAESEFGVVAMDTHPQSAGIREAHSRLDSVGQQAGSIAVPTRADELATAEAKGDYSKALGMKADEVAGWFRNTR